MKVALCSCGVFNLHEIADYVSVTNKIKKLYCKVHENVDFLWSDEPMHKDRDPHFARFALMLYAFSKGYDWAVWMDCDAAPINFKVDLSEWLKGKEQDRVIIEDDVLGINSGVMAVPNTNKCIEWLMYLDSEEIYEKYKNSPFQDQDAIRDSLLENMEFSYLRSKPEPEFGFNHYENLYKWYIREKLKCPNPYVAGDFCLHLAGYVDTYRRLRFQKVLDELENFICPVCGTVSVPYISVPLNRTFDGMAENDLIIGDEKEDCLYCKCPHCGLIHAPQLALWEHEKRRKYIFNERYKDVCKSYMDEEKEKNFCKAVKMTMLMRGDRVVDLGGMMPGLCDKLEEKGVIWADKKDLFFDDNQSNIVTDNQYTAALAINSIERMGNPNIIFNISRVILCRYGQLLIHTPIWDKLNECLMKTPDKWTMLAPRCGIVNILSDRSIEIMASRYGFNYFRDKSNGNLAILEKTCI